MSTTLRTNAKDSTDSNNCSKLDYICRQLLGQVDEPNFSYFLLFKSGRLRFCDFMWLSCLYTLRPALPLGSDALMNAEVVSSLAQVSIKTSLSM